MAMNHRGLSATINDYANLRSFPAMLSAFFLAAGAYQFGLIDPIHFNWALDYTLTTEHATFTSVGVLLIAFMSSETKQLTNYETWEKLFIGATPVIIVGQQYWTEFDNLLLDLGDPLGYQIALVVTIVGWAAAVR